MKIPLLIGGAATSPTHTALKIAPLYSGPVVNVRDASLAPGVLSSLLDAAAAPAFTAELSANHERLRVAQRERSESARRLGIGDARRRAARPDFGSYSPPEPRVRGIVEARPRVRELVPYIDWTFFFYEWGMKKPYPLILDDPELGVEARRLLADARAMLAKMDSEGLVKPAGLCGIFPAASSGDDLVIYSDETRARVRSRIPMLRQQRVKDDGSPQLCLADYLAAAGPQGVRDWLGLFAVTAGEGMDEAAGELASRGDDFGSILSKILCDRLAEALAEMLHAQVRRSIWGYSPGEGFEPEELRKDPYRGIRPAPGYPACPDHRDKAVILELLGAGERIGMTLTESYMMMPAASVSGFYFSHPEAKYFAVGKIGQDQLEDFAARRGESPEESELAVRESLG